MRPFLATSALMPVFAEFHPSTHLLAQAWRQGAREPWADHGAGSQKGSALFFVIRKNRFATSICLEIAWSNRRPCHRSRLRDASMRGHMRAASLRSLDLNIRPRRWQSRGQTSRGQTCISALFPGYLQGHDGQ